MSGWRDSYLHNFAGMDIIVRLHVKLLNKGTNAPITGEEYSVKFYDKDILKDDYLGESSLDAFGHAIVPISRSDYQSADSPMEKYPDIYFTVEKSGKVIYKSPVAQDLHIEETGDFSVSGGLHCNLGTFII